MLQQALVSARRAQQLQPDLGEAHLALSMAASAGGDFTLAQQAAERALAILPNSAEGHYLLGVARKQVLGGEPGIAEKVRLFRRALELDPSYTPARNDLGVTYEQQLKDHAAAVEQFREAVRINPGNPLFRDNLGVNLFQLKRYREALEQFEKALELDPNNPRYRARSEVTRKALGM
jgi:tetratricopeptide (TPR) repeat protein